MQRISKQVGHGKGPGSGVDRRLGIAACALVWIIQSAMANAQTEPELLEAARNCQRIPVGADRLACYDRVLPPETESAAGPVAIVEIRVVRADEAHFRAEDGRVFVQTSGGRLLNLPVAPFDAVLESGAFGSTFLKLPDRNARVRVVVRE